MFILYVVAGLAMASVWGLSLKRASTWVGVMVLPIVLGAQAPSIPALETVIQVGMGVLVLVCVVTVASMSISRHGHA